jgi:hypothetical protein
MAEEEKNTLNFSTNWNNKLGCNCFSTLRKKIFNIGDKIEVYLKNNFQFIVEVVYVYRDITLSDPICYLDTGYDLESTNKIIRKMYHTPKDRAVTKLNFYILKKLKDKKPEDTLFKGFDGGKA